VRLLLGAPLVLLAVAAASRAAAPDATGVPMQAPAKTPVPRTTIQVLATGVHSGKGQLLVALFASEDGFPDQVDHALQRGTATLDGSDARYVFEPVLSGTYAVSVLHDEDGNLEMKTGFFGQPKEGWGVSRNAHNRFGPPSFEDAAFTADGDTVLIELKLRY
jgi:uncharacterized protein (DUF2141 family)